MSAWDNHGWIEALSMPHGSACPRLMLMMALDATTHYQYMWSQRSCIKMQATSEHIGFTEKKRTLVMQRSTASWVEDKKKKFHHMKAGTSLAFQAGVSRPKEDNVNTRQVPCNTAH